MFRIGNMDELKWDTYGCGACWRELIDASQDRILSINFRGN